MIDVAASDMAGNTGMSSATVIVPHDMGRYHGFHKTGQGGGATGVRVTLSGHGSLGYGDQNGVTGFQGGQVVAGSLDLGMRDRGCRFSGFWRQPRQRQWQ